MSFSPSTIWRVGSAFGLSAVGLGAFGAHGLKGRGLPDQKIKNWETVSLIAASGLNIS